jgi:uncharacterized membrane protein
VAILIGVVFAIAVLCSLVISAVGGRLVDEQRAQTLASAVALAAIYEPDMAKPMAVVAGGALESLEDRRTENGTVEAIVRIGAATSDATAFDTWFDDTPTLEP